MFPICLCFAACALRQAAGRRKRVGLINARAAYMAAKSSIWKAKELLAWYLTVKRIKNELLAKQRMGV
jgi:hypothetical protein